MMRRPVVDDRDQANSVQKAEKEFNKKLKRSSAQNNRNGPVSEFDQNQKFVPGEFVEMSHLRVCVQNGFIF